MSADLQSTVVRGALAHLFTSTPAKLLGLALTILAAQILSPGLYGEFNLAVAIYGVSDLLTNPSVFTYFVRTPSASPRALNSAWTFSLVRGVLLTAIFWVLAAPLAALFDGGEGVELLLKILSTTFLIAAIRNPWVVSVYHNLDYRKMALIESVGVFAGNVLAIGLLVLTESPAALAAGVIFNQIFGCAMTWWYASERPKFQLDWKELVTIWTFARFLLINNVVIFLLLQLDDVFVAKVAGLELLGIYSLAFKVANDSVLFLISTLRQVLLPAFVKLVEDPIAFSKASLRAVGTLSAVSWVLASATFAIAPELMLIIAPDPEWRGAEWVLMALMPFVFVRAINGIYGSMLLALGKPGVLSIVSGIQLVGLLPLMWLGYTAGEAIEGTAMGGIIGVTLAIAILNFATNLTLMIFTHRTYGISGWKGLGLMWLLAPTSILATMSAMWVKSPEWSPWIGAVVGISIVVAITIPVWELITRVFSLEVWLDSPSHLIRRARRR